MLNIDKLNRVLKQLKQELKWVLKTGAFDKMSETNETFQHMNLNLMFDEALGEALGGAFNHYYHFIWIWNWIWI